MPVRPRGLDADRNYDRQFGTSQWSLWGQAIRHLNDHYKSQVPLDQQEQAKQRVVSLVVV